MTELAVLRHAPTIWNARGRIQGQVDVPLSEAGRHAVLGWSLPPAMRRWDWYVSPMLRTRETADLLGVVGARAEPALLEMDWGTWEGAELAALRRRLGAAMAANEARGLDFRPEGGETPRELQQRLRPFLRHLAARRRPAAAVAHRGVLRALYCLASGWDMTGRPPEKLRDACLHHFRLAADGAPEVIGLNRPLAR